MANHRLHAGDDRAVGLCPERHDAGLTSACAHGAIEQQGASFAVPPSASRFARSRLGPFRTLFRGRGEFVLLSLWLIFTAALLVWWIYFGFEQISRLAALGYPDSGEIVRFQRMLMWEGATLLLLIVGGAWMVFRLLWREIRVHGEVRAFFTAFTHELRTNLSTLLLKTEQLATSARRDEDSASADVARGLAVEVERIRLQLDNALFATSSGEAPLRSENLRAVEVIRHVAERFPELSIQCSGATSSVVRADGRALETILSNVFSNALIHGKAGGVSCSITQTGRGEQIAIVCEDDGAGFRGDRTKIGERFTRHYEGSGSGLGLAIARELAQRCGGRLLFEADENDRVRVTVILLAGSLPSDQGGDTSHTAARSGRV